jgi:uncharacterized protein with LGFP repeats
MRHALRLLAVLTVLAGSLLSPVATSTPAQPASAADLRGFDPGNIISDAVFFDGLAMDAPAIQDFLNAKGSACKVGTDGTACLKNYSMETFDRSADGLCDGYRGARLESAAVILAKVAASCQVSPRVLLVLLEKEMGLVRTTNPTAKKYDRAAGYACPDSGNGWCDPAYAGLQNQLYRSAWQYQRYAAYPQNYPYRAGRDNVIQWHPSTGCGTSIVRIANQATAGLYSYTPYRPNQAALNAGYGTGDACSSYGNRNFWNYFTDWFGSTQSTGGGEILAKYQSMGGENSPLGAVTGTFYCGLRDGGCFQPFQHGSIYWSRSSGAQPVLGTLLSAYSQHRWETGPLGYPTGDGFCGLRDGGCFQPFQGGSLYWSQASGAHWVRGPIRDAWATEGWEGGWLGYPLTDEDCSLPGGGCTTHFQRGTIYWTAATGARPSNQQMLNAWVPAGMERGLLGYPTTNVVCGSVKGGCFQGFQGGTIYWSEASGSHFVRGSIQAAWGVTQYQSGWLGYPLTNETCGLRDGGCTNHFEHGTIYWSPTTGARPSNPQILNTWVPLGMENGLLGYPIDDVFCGLVGSGCLQNFQGGSVYWSESSGSHFVRGVIRDVWGRTGWENGPLGYPTSDQACGLRGGGCLTHFQNGSIYSSPATGTHPVSGSIRDGWQSSGWENGPWGYPAASAVVSNGNVTQRFQHGTATWDAATGVTTFG